MKYINHNIENNMKIPSTDLQKKNSKPTARKQVHMEDIEKILIL